MSGVDAGQTVVVDQPVHTTEPTADVTKEHIVVRDRYTFTTLLISLLILTIVIITTVTGQWIKARGTGHMNNDEQFDLWGQCTCADSDVAFECSQNNRLVRATQAFTLIANASQVIALIVFIGILTGILSIRTRGVGVAFAWLAAIALILTWTIYLGHFKVTYCRRNVKTFGNLHWAFALRLAESFVWIIAAVLLTTASTSHDHHGRLRLGLFIAIFIFGCSIATTTGRGWVRSHYGERQMSLWETCVCVDAKNFDCDETRRLFRSQEAFAVMSVFITAILTFFILFKLPRFLHVILAFLSFSAIIITWVVFSQWYSQTHCKQPQPSDTFKYYWPFGINVCAFIIGVALFVITLVGACHKF